MLIPPGATGCRSIHLYQLQSDYSKILMDMFVNQRKYIGQCSHPRFLSWPDFRISGSIHIINFRLVDYHYRIHNKHSYLENVDPAKSEVPIWFAVYEHTHMTCNLHIVKVSLSLGLKYWQLISKHHWRDYTPSTTLQEVNSPGA